MSSVLGGSVLLCICYSHWDQQSQHPKRHQHQLVNTLTNKELIAGNNDDDDNNNTSNKQICIVSLSR